MFRFELRHLMLTMVLLAIVFAIQRNLQAVATVYLVFLIVVSPLYIRSVLQALRKAPEHGSRATLLGLAIVGALGAAMIHPDVRQMHAPWMFAVASMPALIGALLWSRARKYRAWLEDHLTTAAMPEKQFLNSAISWRFGLIFLVIAVPLLTLQMTVKARTTKRQVEAADAVERTSGGNIQWKTTPQDAPGLLGWLNKRPGRVHSATVVHNVGLGPKIPHLHSVETLTVSGFPKEDVVFATKTPNVRVLTFDECDFPDERLRTGPLKRLENLVILRWDGTIQRSHVSSFSKCPNLRQMTLIGRLQPDVVEAIREFPALVHLKLGSTTPLSSSDLERIIHLPGLRTLEIEMPKLGEAVDTLLKSSSLTTIGIHLSVDEANAIIKRRKAAGLQIPGTVSWLHSAEAELRAYRKKYPQF